MLNTDASNVGLGVMLSEDENGNDLTISYASKSVNKHEWNKSANGKELLEVYWGIQVFRSCLYGRLFTPHQYIFP